MARKPELAELTTRLALQALGSEGRYKKIFVAGGVGVVLLGIGVFVTVRTIDSNETAAREQAFGSLSSCLLGADALKAGETPSARVANIKLGVVGVPMEKRAKAGEVPWPGSCATFAYQLKEHAGESPIAAAAEALAKALKADANATADLGKEIDQVWAEANNAKLKGAPAGSGTPVAGPKPAVPLYSAEQFKALPKALNGAFTLGNVREAGSLGGKVHFLVDQKEGDQGPALCTVSAAEATMKCQKVPEAAANLSPGLRLVGSTEDSARPFVFAGDRGQLGIIPSSGSHPVAAAVAHGAHARGDGTLAVLGRKEGAKDLRLISVPVTGPTTESPVLQPTDFDAPGQATMAWDWITWRSLAKTGTTSHLFARRIEGGLAKPQVDVGEIDEGAPVDKAERDLQQVHVCKSEDAVVVRVRGQRNDVLAFFAGGRWSTPIKAPTHGGALTCHGLEAVTTTVDHVMQDKDFAVVNQARCNTSGCTPAKVDMRQLLAGMSEIAPADQTSVAAADVGGKLMLVWNGGLAGGLRMRFAAPDKFKEAEDVIITDGRDEKSNVSSIAQIKVIGTNGFAVMLLATTSGLKALKVDSAGKVTPLAG
jgi:hypothetical protein